MQSNPHNDIAMDGDLSFGPWLKQCRKALDLTQHDLAQQVGCSTETIRKIEADRLRPSRQIAERLADRLAIAPAERAIFIHLARARPRTAGLEARAALERERPAASADRAPYLGLNTFQEADAGFFFGREALVEALLHKLDGASFLAVIGPSGSGKSSIVLAGLLPALKGGALPGSACWRYVTFKPGPRPLDALAVAISLHDGGISTPIQASLSSALAVSRAIAESDHALLLAADMLGLRSAATRMVLVVDQFEELWTLAPAEEAARKAFIEQQQLPFIRALLTAAAAPEAPIVIILTLRADFLHRAAENADLARWIAEHDLIVSPMSADEFRRTIVCPARQAGGDFEPGLVEELIEQVAGRVGALPLLEYTLLELWNARHPDRLLTWQAFRALGGVEGALAARADAILDEHYQAAQRDELHRILVRLAQPGDGVADTRRRVLLDDLVPTDGSAEDIQALLQPMVDARLITMDRDMTTGEETVEVSHEALLRAWPTLSRWIDEAREDMRFQLLLDAAAREWRANQENLDFLWSGLRLDRAEEWLARAQPRLNQRDLRFLEASREHERVRAAAAEAARGERERLIVEGAAERRNASRLRVFLIGAAVLLVIAIFFAGLAQNRRQAAIEAESQAQQARATAESAAQASQSFADAGEALFELDHRPEQALLLALASLPTDTTTYPPMIERALYRAFGESSIRRTLTGHADAVRMVAWSPDRRRVLTGSDDGTARIWDAANGTTERILRGHSGPVRAVAFSPDGRLALTGGADGTARIWDVASGAPLQVLKGHTNWISAVAFSPDGRLALTGSYDLSIRVWDVAAARTVLTLTGHTAAVRAVAFSPDGRQILTGADDGTARIWDAASGAQQLALAGASSFVTSVAFSPDGRLVLTAHEDGAARVWDVTTAKVVRTFKGHTGWVWAAAFSPDGQQVLTGSFDGTARLWDVATGRPLHILKGHTDKIWSVTFSPDGQHVLTGSADHTARLWDVTTGTIVRMLRGHSDRIWAAAFSPDGQHVLTGSADHTARLWDVATSTTTQILSGHSDVVSAVAWSPDGRQLLTGSLDSTARLWDAATGRAIRTLRGHNGMVRVVAFSPDGRLALTGGADRTARLWEVATGQQVRIFEGHTGMVRAAIFSPDGRHVLTGDDQTARIWDAATAKLERTLAGSDGPIRAVAFSPDGRLALTGGDSGTARLWDVANGTQLHALEGHTGAVLSAAFSPDGRLALTGSDDGTARLWELAGGTAVYVLEGHTFGVGPVVWSSDGQQALTVSGDQTVQLRIWLVDNDLMIADMTRRLCDLLADAQIREKIPRWRGCAAELAAAAPRLAMYDRVWNGN